MANARSPHRKAEADLIRFGLTLPETETAAWIAPMRELKVRGKTFCIFGAKDEPDDALTLTMKLPVSAGMIEDLPFVLPSSGWMKQHNWVRAYFGPGDDISGNLETLKGWLVQSYVAVAPKRLSRQVQTA